jgi:hypothetical protein
LGHRERVRFVQFYTASYKGRAGKRYIEKTYMDGSHLSESDGQSVSLHEKEVKQNTAELKINDNSDEHITDLEELYFCKLARQKDGKVDPLWKKIMMATNDEVNAHTILFMPGPHYEHLVEQTCGEIAGWVTDVNP